MADMTDQEKNGLLRIVRDARRNGKSYFDIEHVWGIPAAQAEAIMSEYLRGRAGSGNIEEMRYLQLERFEGMIQPMMERVELGDVKAAEALVKILGQINETIGVVKEQAKVEITIINQQQGEAVFKMMDHILGGMLALVQSVVKDPEVLGEIEDQWDDRVPALMRGAREKIVDAEVLDS